MSCDADDVYKSMRWTQGVLNEKEFSSLLSKKKAAIISNLGGMEKVIQLCLTNENADYTIGGEDVLSLEALFGVAKREEELQLQQAQSVPLDSNNFWQEKISLSINASNNFYFVLLPNKIAAFVFYNIILNKYYALSIVGLYFATAVSARIFVHLSLYVYVWPVGWSCLILALIFALTQLLSVNLDVGKNVLQTFDFLEFWYVFISRLFCYICKFINSKHLLTKVAESIVTLLPIFQFG